MEARGVERRTLTAPVSYRTSPDGSTLITGHGAVFNSLSENLGVWEDWYEEIVSGAFDAVLASNPNVVALFNHDVNYPMARTTVPSGAGSLKLGTDEVGLAYTIDPALRSDGSPLSYVADLIGLMAAGVITQSSFAFVVGTADWIEREMPDGSIILVRQIKVASELFDVSPVTYPAYPAADSGLDGVEFDSLSRGRITVSRNGERNDDGEAAERVEDGAEAEPLETSNAEPRSATDATDDELCPDCNGSGREQGDDGQFVGTCPTCSADAGSAPDAEQAGISRQAARLRLMALEASAN